MYGASNMADRRAKKPRAFAEAVSGATAPLSRRRGFANGLIVSEWRAIVGDRLAGECAPEALRFPPKQRCAGTLRLRVSGGGLALELQHLQGQLIERINAHLGYDAVERIQFVQGPVPKRPPTPPPARPTLSERDAQDLQRLVATVDDPELRAALESLGRSVFARGVPT